jgi:eukaryotic-like serine/threonine-protein kinase
MARSHGVSWEEISPYLDEALELDLPQREVWLATLHTSHPAVARELRELLALHAANSASGFLERSPSLVDDSLLGERIGAYTIERLLGRGGMASVWLGRRSDGKFEGQAAIKLLERGGLTGDAAAEIRREASLLARLSHPHIAQLLDAGVRDNGQPYIILEFVDGNPIDEYCRTHRLPLTARLRLFLDVLDAVAHAHNHLVVHRDLKPSNVLVTREGAVKLLDFGVAALWAESARRSAGPATSDQREALTPGYAAPEQLRGEPLSLSTDVYALGVLLHVLVTGAHPFDTSGSTPADVARMMLTRDPPPASERAVASERRQVRGDLDAIITRALQREPLRRYAIAAELAADIRRLLGNFPVHARATTRAYVAHKFAQRHRGAVASAAVTLLTLVAATVVTTQQMLEARHQRDFAHAQLARAEALNDLNDFVLRDAAPSGRPFTVNALLTRAAHALQRQQTTDAIRVSLLAAIGGEYDSADEDSTARGLLEEAYRLSRNVADPSARAQAACALGRIESKGAYSPRADALIATGLKEIPAGAEFAFDRYLCLLGGSEVAFNHDDAALGVERAQAALHALEHVPFAHAMAELHAQHSLAEAYRVAGRFDDAIETFARAWPRLVALGRDDTMTAASWLNNWGLDLFQLGRPLEAEKLLRRSMEIARTDASGGQLSPMSESNYAMVLVELARDGEAATYAEHAYQRALQAGDHVAVNQALLRLALIRIRQRDYGRAIHVLDEAETRLHADLPAGHNAFGSVASLRSLAAQGQGDTTKALELANQALAIVEASVRQHRPGAQFLPLLLTRRASIEIDASQLGAAERDARQSLSLLRKARADDWSSYVGTAYLTLARILRAEGHPAEAQATARRAADQLEKALGAEHPDTRAARELTDSTHL